MVQAVSLSFWNFRTQNKKPERDRLLFPVLVHLFLQGCAVNYSPLKRLTEGRSWLLTL